MTRLSKRALLAAIPIVALAVTSGCTAEPADGGDNVLSIMTGWTPDTAQGAILQDIVNNIEEETGITVEVLITDGAAVAQAIETAAVGGALPDIVLTNLIGRTSAWVSEGITVPVETAVADWGLEDRFFDGALDAWTIDGSLTGFPHSSFVWPVLYNMELLGEVGFTEPPQSVDELQDLASSLLQANITPMVTGGSDWSGNKLFLQIIQSYMDSAETTDVFSNGGYCDSPNAVRGIELFTELRDAGLFVASVEGYSADQAHEEFYAGNAAFLSGGNWTFEGALGLDVELGGFPVPTDGAFGQPTAYNGFTSTGVMVTRDGGENLDLVREFVTRFYSEDTAARWLTEVGSPLSFRGAEGVEAANALLTQAATELPERIEWAVMPDTVLPSNVLDPLERQTSAAFARNGQDAQQICAALDSTY